MLTRSSLIPRLSWNANMYFHACTTSMFAFRSVGAWERDYTRSHLEETYKTVEYCVYKRSCILLSCTVAKSSSSHSSACKFSSQTNSVLSSLVFYKHMHTLALFPGLPWLQFLIACSMQKLEPHREGLGTRLVCMLGVAAYLVLVLYCTMS